MSSPWRHRHYDITPDHANTLADCEYRCHEYHYKNGQNRFEGWLRQACNYTKDYLHLNHYRTLANQCVGKGFEISPSALYDLERWLRGRQFCYAHHLLQKDADEGHCRPIWIARELVHIFKANEAEEIIHRCTPANLSDLVHQLGSIKEKARYPLTCTRTATVCYLTRSEQEDKMAKTDASSSWRRGSVSSISSASSSIASLTFDEPRGREQNRRRQSSVTTLSSQSTGRSSSPEVFTSRSSSRSPTSSSYAKVATEGIAVSAVKLPEQQTRRQSAPSSTTIWRNSGKLVLKLREAY